MSLATAVSGELLVWGTIAIVLVSVFVSRGIFRWLEPQNTDRDGYAHFTLISDIRDANHRIPRRPSGIVTEGSYRYPFLMHWLLSFLPQPSVHTLDRYFSPIMDLLFAGMFVALIPAGLLSPAQTGLALLVFLATPEFMRPDLSHGIGISARKPGLLVTTLSLLSFSMWIETRSGVLLVGAILFGALIYLTSKFSLQAFVAASLALSIGGKPTALGVAVAAFMAAVVLSAGQYGYVLAGHVRHAVEYALELQYTHLPPVTTPDEVFKDLQEAGSFVDVARIIHLTPWLNALVNNPFVFAVAGTYGLLYTTGAPLPIPGGFHYWIAGTFTAFALTSIPPFRFLGQAERYLEYGFLPSIVLVAHAWTVFGMIYLLGIVALVVAGAAVIAGYVWLFYLPRVRKSDDEAWDEFLDGLRRYEPGTVVLQPSNKGREVNYRTDHKVVDFMLNGGSPGVKSERKRLMPERYGHVTDDAAYLADRYDPDWVVFDLGDDVAGLVPPDEPPDLKVGDYELYAFEKFGRSTLDGTRDGEDRI